MRSFKIAEILDIAVIIGGSWMIKREMMKEKVYQESSHGKNLYMLLGGRASGREGTMLLLRKEHLPPLSPSSWLVRGIHGSCDEIRFNSNQEPLKLAWLTFIATFHLGRNCQQKCSFDEDEGDSGVKLGFQGLMWSGRQEVFASGKYKIFSYGNLIVIGQIL